ncbi:MAG: CocE/NonD family hydrolase [Dongiaceae bacterium]
MDVVERFPHEVREVDTAWIPLADGTRLAARLWLPADAEARPVPAILEYIPYRRRDGTAIGDRPTHLWFAGHGYAAVRVDMRGSGDSDGILLDEYLKQEQDDALEVIAWIAAQPWCSGAVGMMGISWGGFNSLQVAARRPPALKAILTVCSTDDRYADDCHYMGGCLLGDSLAWGSTFFAYNSRPPDPQVVGARWRAMWLDRLEHATLFLERWVREQRRSAYWRHGSVCEDYGAIAAAVYAVGGWADGYSNAVPRLLAHLDAPKKGLVGPWAHAYPHMATPGPAIGFLQEALRWWDRWLKGVENGIMEEPAYRVWLQDSAPPAAQYATRPGRWVAEAGWPAPRIRPLTLRLGPGRLAAGPQPPSRLLLRSPQTTGLAAGDWCPYGVGGELPVDQRPDDGRSLVFDGTALAEPLEMLGAPVLTLELESDRPNALLCARLCDVAPDGASTLVTIGILNLTHRDGDAEPRPLVPGQPTRIRLQLNDVAHAFATGHRIRLALSNAYWPMVWPSPEPVSLTLHAETAALELPQRPPGPLDSGLAPFGPPQGAAPPAHATLSSSSRDRTVTEDLSTGETVMRVQRAGGSWRLDEIGLTMAASGVEHYRIRPDDPLSARAEAEWSYRMERPGWSVRTETRTLLTATAAEFLLTATLDAYEGDMRVFARTWESRIPRDLL